MMMMDMMMDMMMMMMMMMMMIDSARVWEIAMTSEANGDS